MNKKINFYLNGFTKNEIGASEASIMQLLKQIDFTLPIDYLDLMKAFNGGEGEVGENSWLCLFPIEDLIATNKNYNLLLSQIPDYFLFGKDAADTGYAFNKQQQTVHSFGLISDFRFDVIEFCGNSFAEFIEYLYNQ